MNKKLQVSSIKNHPPVIVEEIEPAAGQAIEGDNVDELKLRFEIRLEVHDELEIVAKTYGVSQEQLAQKYYCFEICNEQKIRKVQSQ